MIETRAPETGQQPPGTTRSGDWSRLETELKLWGRKLDELRQQSDRVGDSVIAELQRRYETLTKETEALKRSTDREIRLAREELERTKTQAQAQSHSRVGTTVSKAKEGARSVREISQGIGKRTGETARAMSKGARHLGAGFARAWSELRKGFQQAYSSLN